MAGGKAILLNFGSRTVFLHNDPLLVWRVVVFTITTLSCAPKKGWCRKKGGRGFQFARREQAVQCVGQAQ